MSTAKQTDANRRNATKSTGPSSAEGKAASSQNALKTGIDAESLVIRGESRPTLEALTTRYLDRFQPSTPEQSVLVDALISADWLLRRLRKVEPQLWEIEFKDAKTWDRYHKDVLYGDAFGHGKNDFNRLQRRLDSMERSYHRALESLRTLRPDCFKPPNIPPAQPPESITPLPPTEIGFVPQPPEKPDPSPAAPPSAPELPAPPADAAAAVTPDPPPQIGFVPQNANAGKHRPKRGKAGGTACPTTESTEPTPEVAQPVPPAHPAVTASDQVPQSTQRQVPTPPPQFPTKVEATGPVPSPNPPERREPKPPAIPADLVDWFPAAPWENRR